MALPESRRKAHHGPLPHSQSNIHKTAARRSDPWAALPTDAAPRYWPRNARPRWTNGRRSTLPGLAGSRVVAVRSAYLRAHKADTLTAYVTPLAINVTCIGKPVVHAHQHALRHTERPFAIGPGRFADVAGGCSRDRGSGRLAADHRVVFPLSMEGQSSCSPQRRGHRPHLPRNHSRAPDGDVQPLCDTDLLAGGPDAVALLDPLLQGVIQRGLSAVAAAVGDVHDGLP